MHRIAILSAVGALALAGQANGAPVQCPSISFTRTPVHGKPHHAANPKPNVQTVKHRHAAKPRAAGTMVAKRAAGPRPTVVASNTLPVLAPILPPDTMPSTTPVLAPGVQPATPIIGYTLKRSVKMVACEPVPMITTARNLLTTPGGPASEAAYIPTAFQPPVVDQFQTSPPPPGSPPPNTPPGCCDLPPKVTPPPPPGVVPEPATWAMLIVGFFGLGAQLRRSGRRARDADAGTPQAG